MRAEKQNGFIVHKSLEVMKLFSFYLNQFSQNYVNSQTSKRYKLYLLHDRYGEVGNLWKSRMENLCIRCSIA